MAVDDTTIWIIFMALFNYAIVYRRNVIFGSVGYIALALVMLSVSNDTVYAVVGIFVLIGSLVNIMYELLSKYYQGGLAKRIK